MPETPANSTVQDAETLLPSLCEAAPLELPPEVASESEAAGFPSDQTSVEPSSNATAVTDASSSVHTATTQSETSTAKNEADETLPPERIDKNPVEIVAKANDIHLPDNLTLTYPLPPDASGKDTDNMDPVVMETPAVSDASAGLSAINNGEYVEPSHANKTSESPPEVALQSETCNLPCIVANTFQNGRCGRWETTSKDQLSPTRTENGPDGVANNFIVFADAFHGDPAAEAAL